MTDRTSLKLNDERKRLFEQASQIVAGDPTDNPHAAMLSTPLSLT